MKILIIRLSSFGDIILTTPVISAFKKRYPDSQIDFLVLSNFKDAISGNPDLHNIITFNKETSDGYEQIKKFAKLLKEENYDYVFDLHSKLRSKIIVHNLGVKTYTYKKRKLWKTLLVKLRMIKYQVDDTIIKNYFGAFKEFDIHYSGENLKFFFDEKDKEKVSKYQDHPIIAPGASKNTKKWPVEYFKELAEMLYKKYNKKVIILGGNEDVPLAKMISNKEHTIDLTGQLSIKESGALLSQSKFLICNDSAPFHIARAFKIPTFVIFGPTSPQMFDFAPTDHLIFANEKCSPCSLHGDKICPKKHFACMKNITPKIVFDRITEQFKDQ